MSNETDTKVDPRHVAGSAKGSETSIACACGVLLFFAMILITVFSDVPEVEEALARTAGIIVLAVCALCMIGFALLSIWANSLETDGVSTISDIGVVQAIAWILLVTGLLTSLLLGF